VSIVAGVLYIVATPIGNLNDISPRALEVLSTVDLIAAEDTRHSARLLRHYRIQTPCRAYHDYNEQSASRALLEQLEQGRSIALISDAGTPLISDPGYRLIKEAQSTGIRVMPIPGPCALIAALSASGLPTDRFVFEGFLPAKAQARRRRLTALSDVSCTLVFYESSHRILEALADLVGAFGSTRRVCLARETTKQFETIRTAPVQEILDWVVADSDQSRGEFVRCVEGATEQSEPDAREARRVLDHLSDELPGSQAVKLAARITGLSKNRLYAMLLEDGGGRE